MPGRKPKKYCLTLSMGKMWCIEFMIILSKIPEVPLLSRDYGEPGQVLLGRGMPKPSDLTRRKGSQGTLWEKGHSLRI